MSSSIRFCTPQQYKARSVKIGSVETQAKEGVRQFFVGFISKMVGAMVTNPDRLASPSRENVIDPDLKSSSLACKRIMDAPYKLTGNQRHATLNHAN
jgi:hypothetical protein